MILPYKKRYGIAQIFCGINTPHYDKFLFHYETFKVAYDEHTDYACDINIRHEIFTGMQKVLRNSLLPQKVWESINTGLDYWNGGLALFNALYLVTPISHVHTHIIMIKGLTCR